MGPQFRHLHAEARAPLRSLHSVAVWAQQLQITDLMPPIVDQRHNVVHLEPEMMRLVEAADGLPASSAALPARAQPVRSTFADNDRRLLQCLPSLDDRRLIPSGLGRVQPERCPPQPRQWIGVGSGNTGPGLSLWLPVGGGPVFHRRRCHGRGRNQQLPQQRYFLVRRWTVLAGPTTGQCPFAVPYGRPGQLRPGPGVRFPQFRNAGSGYWLTPRSLFLPNRIIFSPIHQTVVNTIHL